MGFIGKSLNPCDDVMASICSSGAMFVVDLISSQMGRDNM